MSVKNCGIDIDVTSLQDEINILADEANDLNNEVIDLTDQVVTDNILIQANGANIAQLNTNVLKIGGIYGVPVYAWSTQEASFITIPKTTGTWIGCFNDINLNLTVSGTYMVSLNFMTFINNDNIGHNPITVGCELFQDNIGLVTNFTSSCGVTTSYPIKDTGTSFDGLYGFGVNMSFPVVIGDPSLPFSLSLYYFFNNDSDQTILISNGCPNSGNPLDWWRNTINTGNSFSMTLLSTDSI